MSNPRTVNKRKWIYFKEDLNTWPFLLLLHFLIYYAFVCAAHRRTLNRLESIQKWNVNIDLSTKNKCWYSARHLNPTFLYGAFSIWMKSLGQNKHGFLSWQFSRELNHPDQHTKINRFIDFLHLLVLFFDSPIRLS